MSAACKRVVLLLAFLLGTTPVMAAPKGGSARHGKIRRPAERKAVKRQTAKHRRHRRRRRRAMFRGHVVAASALRSEPLPRASGRIHLYSVNTRDEVKVQIFRPDGSYDEQAIARLNRFVRSRGAVIERAIEPRLYEVLSLINDHYDGRVLEMISGFRDQKETESYHYLGSAIDMRVRGISIRRLRDYVATLDAGGMGLGIYPRTGFIHVDIRPEPSYRWVDYSGHRRPKRTRKVPRS